MASILCLTVVTLVCRLMELGLPGQTFTTAFIILTDTEKGGHLGCCKGVHLKVKRYIASFGMPISTRKLGLSSL